MQSIKRFLAATTLLPAILVLATGSTATCQQTNWRAERNAIERQYAEALQNHANQLREDGDAETANTIIRAYRPRDLQRQYIFIPSPAPGAVNPDDTALIELNAEHGKRIYELAKRAANEGAGAFAFQLIHEAIYFAPDLEEARRVLNHRKTEEGWRVSVERIRSRKATKKQEIMGWRSKAYLQVTTPHFIVDSLASEEETIELARKLERWHDVWRQVFFEYWSNSKTLARWMDGSGQLRKSTRKYKVVFFPDKESYASQLEKYIPGISASTGYYSDEFETSFFYAGEPETSRHELTHQLFQEAIRARKGAFATGYVWLGEGIAMYFESMTDFGDYVTLGGFDSRRLQYSRLRAFRERFYVPLNQISGMSLREFQGSQNLRRLYSQSAGMCHMLMNGNDGENQKRLVEFLKLMYMGKLKSDTFTKILKLDDESFKQLYATYLSTPNERIEKHLMAHSEREQFSLGNPDLSIRALKEIGKCEQLLMLDLAENPINSEKLRALQNLDQLETLYLSNCKLENGALSELAKLSRLSEVDLSASDCTDNQFLELAGCPSLKVVTITATRISNAAISQLKQKRPELEVQK